MIQTTKISEIFNPTSDSTEFAFEVPFFEFKDIRAFVADIAGNETELTLDAIIGGFSIVPKAGDTKLGATIITTEAYGVGITVVITRELDITQLINFQRGGSIPSESLNEGLDRSTAIDQQIADTIRRTITFPLSDPEGLDYSVPPVGTRANKALAFDVDGNVVVISLVSSGSIAVDDTKGLRLNNNVISAITDNTTIQFDINGRFEIKEGGILTNHLSDNLITLDKMTDDSVGTAEIIDGSVTDVKLVTVDGGKLDDDSIEKIKLVEGIVSSEELAGNIDIDTIMTPGHYVGYEGTVLWTNYPAQSDQANTAYIEVRNSGDTAYLEQEFRDGITQVSFVRYRINSVWGAWFSNVPRDNSTSNYIAASTYLRDRYVWLTVPHSISLTPRSANNSIEVDLEIEFHMISSSGQIIDTDVEVLRDGIPIISKHIVLHKDDEWFNWTIYNESDHVTSATIRFTAYELDEPNTTNPVTYTVRYKAATAASYINVYYTTKANSVWKLREYSSVIT